MDTYTVEYAAATGKSERIHHGRIALSPKEARKENARRPMISLLVESKSGTKQYAFTEKQPQSHENKPLVSKVSWCRGHLTG